MDTQLDVMKQFPGFLEIMEKGLIEIMVIDGLDASGKGTVADVIAQIEATKRNVLQIEYPQYNSRWGRFLKYSLRNELGLSMKAKMALYAINRLESVHAIRSHVERMFIENGAITTMIFDRFSTSNLVTAAYYLLNNNFAGKPAEELEELIERGEIGKYIDMDSILETILELDKSFHELLGINLSKVKVIIPQINPREAQERLGSDNSRADTDLYEKLNIQLLADYLYLKASQNSHFNIIVLPQEGRSPNEIGENMIEVFKEGGRIDDQKNDDTGETITATIEVPQDYTVPEYIEIAINKLLESYPELLVEIRKFEQSL